LGERGCWGVGPPRGDRLGWGGNPRRRTKPARDNKNTIFSVSVPGKGVGESALTSEQWGTKKNGVGQGSCTSKEQMWKRCTNKKKNSWGHCWVAKRKGKKKMSTSAHPTGFGPREPSGNNKGGFPWGGCLLMCGKNDVRLTVTP